MFYFLYFYKNMVLTRPKTVSFQSAYDPYFLPPNPKAVKQTQCKEAYSYCGLMESRYPDMRPMGYPWDRQVPQWASTLADFLTPNMVVQEIVIKHVNTTVPPMEDIPDLLYPMPIQRQ